MSEQFICPDCGRLYESQTWCNEKQTVELNHWLRVTNERIAREQIKVQS